MNIIISGTFTSSKKFYAKCLCTILRGWKVVNSDLTRLFLKLAGCEIDLDILEFVSSAVDFEFENVSFWIKFVIKLTFFSISNFFIFRFKHIQKRFTFLVADDNHGFESQFRQRFWICSLRNKIKWSSLTLSVHSSSAVLMVSYFFASRFSSSASANLFRFPRNSFQ